MRKQTRLVAVLSATALLAIGASAAAFAAGWDNSTGEWQWLDNDGVAISNEWRQSGNDWFYLGDDGNMVVDSIVEDTSGSTTRYYYVNEAGAMVSNTWVAIDNTDSDLECDYFWYYFGNNGRAYTSTGELSTSKLETINGQRYAFDSEGKMLYGWVDRDIDSAINESDDAWVDGDYYFGDWTDGAMRTGWQQMAVDDDGDTETYWFWFDSNGRKTYGTASNANQRRIDGRWYQFDSEDGHMLDDWSVTTGSISASPSVAGNLIYLNGDGAKRTRTWIWAVPSEDYLAEDYNNDEARWWYVGADGSLYVDNIRKINGRRYAFDSYGRMKTGLVEADLREDNVNYYNVASADDANGNDYAAQMKNNVYLFGGTDDGSMKTGYQNVEFDDDTYQMYFDTTTGVGKTGFVNRIKKFTASGVVLRANSDISNYAGIAVDTNTLDENNAVTTNTALEDADLHYGLNSKGLVLVNTSGAIMKNKTNMRDTNDYYYCTDNQGFVEYVGTERVRRFNEDRDDIADSVDGLGVWIVND